MNKCVILSWSFRKQPKSTLEENILYILGEQWLETFALDPCCDISSWDCCWIASTNDAYSWHMQRLETRQRRIKLNHIQIHFHQHWFPIDTITSHNNIKSIPTKHRVTILIFCFYMLLLKNQKGWIMSEIIVEVALEILGHEGNVQTLNGGHLHLRFKCSSFYNLCAQNMMFGARNSSWLWIRRSSRSFMSGSTPAFS